MILRVEIEIPVLHHTEEVALIAGLECQGSRGKRSPYTLKGCIGDLLKSVLHQIHRSSKQDKIVGVKPYYGKRYGDVVLAVVSAPVINIKAGDIRSFVSGLGSGV